MAVYLDYRQAQNKTVLLTHESTRKKPSKYTNRDLKHEKGDELEREGGSVCVCVCVCVWEREREKERKGGRGDKYPPFCDQAWWDFGAHGWRKKTQCEVLNCGCDLYHCAHHQQHQEDKSSPMALHEWVQSCHLLPLQIFASQTSPPNSLVWGKPQFSARRQKQSSLQEIARRSQRSHERGREEKEETKGVWVHTKEEDWAARGQNLPELKKTMARTPPSLSRYPA